MPLTIPHQFIRAATTTAFKRIGTAIALLIGLASPAAANYSGTWYFQGISKKSGVNKTTDVTGELRLTLIEPGVEFGAVIRYSAQGYIGGVTFNTVLQTGPDGYQGFESKGVGDTPYDGVTDFYTTVKLLNLRDANFIGLELTNSFLSQSTLPWFSAQWRINHFTGVLTKKFLPGEPEQPLEGRFNGRSYHFMNSPYAYSFCENFSWENGTDHSHEIIREAGQINSYFCYYKTHPRMDIGVKNPILFTKKIIISKPRTSMSVTALHTEQVAAPRCFRVP